MSINRHDVQEKNGQQWKQCFFRSNVSLETCFLVNINHLFNQEEKELKNLVKKLATLTVLTAVILTTSVVTTGCGDDSSKSGSSDTTEASGDASGDLTTVRFGYMTGNIDHLITAVGVEKGIFEKNGIDLKTTEYAAGINTVDALTMDQLDIGIAADFAILNRIGNTEKSDLKIVANYANAVGGQLYANPETVKDKNDLKGKRIINLPGGLRILECIGCK